MRSAKDNLPFKEIIGHTQTRRQGFGTNEKQRWSKTSGKNRWDMVIPDVRSEVNNKRFLKGVQPPPKKPMDKLGGDLAKVYYLERQIAGGYSQVGFSNTIYV